MTARDKANVSPASLKASAIAKQLWHNDRAFKTALSRGKEKGFTDMKDYTSKRDTYLEEIRAKLKDSGESGERNSKRLAMSGFLRRLSPIVVVIVGIAFAYYAMSNHFFMPDTGEHLFTAPTPKPSAVVATPVAGMPSVQVTVHESQKQTDLKPILVTVAIGISIMFFFFFFVRRLTKRRKAKQPEQAPEPEEPSAE